MDIWIVIIFLGFLLFYGIYQGFRVKNSSDFATGGGGRGLFVVFASLSAAFIGGGFSTGNAARCYESGVANIVGLFGFSAAQMLIGTFVIRRARLPENAQSPGEIAGAYYGRGARVTSGVCAALLAIGLIGAQVAAIGSIFSALLGVSYTAGVLIGFSIVMVYATAGGMSAIITAEVVEFCLLAVGIPVLAFFSIKHAGGLETMLSSLPDGFLDPTSGGAMPLVALFFTMFIGEALSPTYLQRMLTGRDRRTMARATTLSGLLSIPIFCLTGVVGLAAAVSLGNIEPPQAMPSMVLAALPVGLKGVVITSMLAIVMSSADGLLSSASIAIANDIISPLKRKPMKPKPLLRAMRLSSLAVGALGMALALGTSDVFSLLVLAYAAWAPVMLVPLTAAMLGVKAGASTFFASAIFGAATAVAFGVMVGGDYGGALAGTAVSLLAFVVGQRLEVRALRS